MLYAERMHRYLLPLALLLVACDPADARPDGGLPRGPGPDVGPVDAMMRSDAPAPRCGDGMCNGTDDCGNCEADCGACGAVVCGDGTCSTSESCGTCESDCGLCDVPATARRVCIGDGSGELNYPDAMTTLGLNPGDVLCIRAGTYSGMDLGNLRGNAAANITVVNEGAVEFTGGIRFHDLSYVDVRGDGTEGVDFGFHLRDNTYRGITINGAIQHVTWTHFELTDIGDYAIFIFEPTLIFDGSDESALTDLRFFDFRARRTALGLFQIGSFRGWPAQTSIVNGLEIARADIEDAQRSCTIINASLSLNVNIHHNRIVNTGEMDRSHCGVIFLQGNGAIHHNDIRDFWGNAARTWCIGTPGHDTIDFYNNLVVGSRKYSGFEAQGFAADLAVPPATTCRFRVFNNTFGDLTALDYVAAMVDAYELVGSTLEVRNNLGFNIAQDQPFDAERNYAVHYVGVDREDVTEGTNLHARTFAEVGLVDGDACELAAGSPAINAGETLEVVTNDLSGISRPQGASYDLGARERRE